jgi:hypothetical protein
MQGGRLHSISYTPTRITTTTTATTTAIIATIAAMGSVYIVAKSAITDMLSHQ